MIQPKLHTNWKLIVFFMLSFQFCVFAQQVSALQNGIKGIWTQNTADNLDLKKWEAQWIWMQEHIASDVMLARRSFDLKELSKEAILRISASSKYELSNF